ncbi:PKD domain-containing protein [Halobaculum limi]|uniref:PKD domain-containing protein n=1 Tax=Halobaculum limi TaxID=3031916 RepID=UPI0024058157|nr:hemagglutinin repeat-containing protein [Halobaculum sp. YSMS11]
MDNRAATESIGTVLLVGVVVVVASTAGSGVLLGTAELRAQSDRTQLSLETEVTASNVTLTHVGTTSVETDSARLLLRSGGDRRGPVSLADPTVNGTGLDDGSFDVGDSVRLSHTFSGYIDVLLVSAETGDRLYQTLRSTATPTPFPTPAASSTVTADAAAPPAVGEGFSITLDGSGSTTNAENITSYSWAIASGSGSITEDGTNTPNATYVAPDDVSANETVSLELTVTDSAGNTDTTTLTVTVVDIDAAPAPEDGDGDGSAFDDANGNGVYDENETIVTKEELESGYNDPSTDLVIYPSVGEVRTNGAAVDITAKTITSGADFRANGDVITLTAEGDIDISGGILESNGNGDITVTSTNGNISAVGTTFDAGGGVVLESNGDINLDSAVLLGDTNTADLGTPAATLSVNETSIDGKGKNGDTLVYSPTGVTVVGSPSTGTVVPA